MLSKTKIALAAALVALTATAASAQEFDPNLANRYPGYNGPVAAAPSATFQSAPVRLERHRRLQEAPVRLQEEQGTFGEPLTTGAGHAPGAFYQQQQPGFPQSPPGGGY